MIGIDLLHLEALLSFKTSSYFSVDEEKDRERNKLVRTRFGSRVSFNRENVQHAEKSDTHITGEDTVGTATLISFSSPDEGDIREV